MQEDEVRKDRHLRDRCINSVAGEGFIFFVLCCRFISLFTVVKEVCRHYTFIC